jgi:uncharacterized protein YqeY
MSSELAARLTADMKLAMKAREKLRLGAIRMALAAIKQREIDDRCELDDSEVLAVLDKMVKQRRDSLSQFEKAGREDLAAIERGEIEVLKEYLPQALSEAEIATLIDEVVAETQAESMQDMGRVMGLLKPRVQGRADMGQVSAQVRARLNA